MPDRRRSFNAIPCAHDDIDTTEICSIAGDRLYQRQKCDPDSPAIWGASEKLYRREFLGPRCFVSTVGLDEEMVNPHFSPEERAFDCYLNPQRIFLSRKYSPYSAPSENSL